MTVAGLRLRYKRARAWLRRLLTRRPPCVHCCRPVTWGITVADGLHRCPECFWSAAQRWEKFLDSVTPHPRESVC